MLSSIHNCNYVRIRSTGCDVPIAYSVSGNTAKLTRMRRKHRDAATPQRHGQCAGQPSVSSIPIPSVTVHAFDISPPSSSVVLCRPPSNPKCFVARSDSRHQCPTTTRKKKQPPTQPNSFRSVHFRYSSLSCLIRSTVSASVRLPLRLQLPLNWKRKKNERIIVRLVLING